MPIRDKSFLLFLFLFVPLAPLAPPLFPHDAEIKIDGENRYKSVRLIPRIYNEAHRNLSDLLIKNGDENIPYFINSSSNLQTSEETFFIESFRPEFTVETKDKITKILIKGLKNFRLCDLQIETDSMFIRKATALGGQEKELYNLSVNGATYNTDTVLPLNRKVSENEIFTVIINDADDKPININGIVVRYYADDLVFQGNVGDVYRLEFGVDLSRSAPVYDIERYKDEILKGSIDRLELGEIVYVKAGQPREKTSYRVIFDIVIVLVGILLGILIILKLKAV
jgi:hypothetical protein